MDNEEAKIKVDFHKLEGYNRIQTIEMVEALQLDGNEREVLEYLNTIFLPEVQVKDRSLKDKSADTITALRAFNSPPTVFNRGGHIVRIAGAEDGVPYIETLNENAFRGVIERAASFIRLSSKGEKTPVSPPLDVTRDVMTFPELNLPPLVNIVEIPVIRPDGTILETPGYDAETKLYFQPAPGLAVPPVSRDPAESERREALSLVLEPFLDFPFDSEASRASAVAGLLTPIVRPMVRGCLPMLLFDKPQAGTGASLCAELISRISTGRVAFIAAPLGPFSNDEWEKRLTSLLRQGRSVVIFDNIVGVMYAPSLSMILTVENVECRILGKSEVILLPNRATLIATGNNVKLVGDLPRRVYYSRMDAEEPRPWMRDPSSFKHCHLIEWVTENRGRILWAGMTLARAWISAGRPKDPQLPTLGGFEGWAETIGGILAHAGISGFLGNLEFLYSHSDFETAQWQGFLEAWSDKFGDDDITGGDIKKAAEDDDQFRNAIPDLLADSLEKKTFSNKLGKALSKMEGVRFPNGFMICKGDQMRHHASTWCVRNYRQTGSSTEKGEFGFDEKGDLGSKGEFGEFPLHRKPYANKEQYKDGYRENSPNSPPGSKQWSLGGANSPFGDVTDAVTTNEELRKFLEDDL